MREAKRQKVQRVVVVGVPTEVDEDSILETTGAIVVHSIYKRDLTQNKIRTTMAIDLAYSCTSEKTPARVQFGYLTFKTRTYIPLVTRCFKCQKYGHIQLLKPVRLYRVYHQAHLLVGGSLV